MVVDAVIVVYMFYLSAPGGIRTHHVLCLCASIADKHVYLSGFLAEMSPHSLIIHNWHSNGQVFWDFLHIHQRLQQLNELKQVCVDLCLGWGGALQNVSNVFLNIFYYKGEHLFFKNIHLLHISAVIIIKLDALTQIK